MYCKRAGSNGPVMLYTAIKQKSPEYVVCNADGSDLNPPIDSTAVRVEDVAIPETPKRKKREVKEAPVVADYASGDDISFE